ncbi:hypothetical protein F4805DRAFT_427609 [Annulohypoxylon moriforme]|nr:hypothetical protein F4805DRAFT_427609 [Annulohypoxylon moriforme]
MDYFSISPASTPAISPSADLLDMPSPTSPLCDRCYEAFRGRKRPDDDEDDELRNRGSCVWCLEPVGGTAGRDGLGGDWLDVGGEADDEDGGWVDVAAEVSGSELWELGSEHFSTEGEEVAGGETKEVKERKGGEAPKGRKLKPRPSPAVDAAEKEKAASARGEGVKKEKDGKQESGEGKGKKDRKVDAVMPGQSLFQPPPFDQARFHGSMCVEGGQGSRLYTIKEVSE